MGRLGNRRGRSLLSSGNQRLFRSSVAALRRGHIAQEVPTLRCFATSPMPFPLVCKPPQDARSIESLLLMGSGRRSIRGSDRLASLGEADGIDGADGAASARLDDGPDVGVQMIAPVLAEAVGDLAVGRRRVVAPSPTRCRSLRYPGSGRRRRIQLRSSRLFRRSR